MQHKTIHRLDPASANYTLPSAGSTRPALTAIPYAFFRPGLVLAPQKHSLPYLQNFGIIRLPVIVVCAPQHYLVVPGEVSAESGAREHANTETNR
ncbi:MAG: hypothetical protein P4N59_03030 [Negativicutes bacterium]|nr:hypothetical protein [Negativicutes bacterium]